MTKTKTEPKVRINTTIVAEPANILLELKRRGLVTSNTDAVIQALYALHERILNHDLRLAKLKTLKEAEE